MTNINSYVNAISITLNKMAEMLPILYELRYPIMIWGMPGIGKSQIISQFCKAQGLKCIVKMLSQTEPGDLLGLPTYTEKNGRRLTTYATPDWLPFDPNWRGVIFLDEIPEADDRLRAPAYQLLNDRRLGTYELPAGAWVVGAGNTPEDGALYAEMPKALSDRFCHFHVVPDINVTLEYAIANDWHPAVIAYLKYQPAHLYPSDEYMKNQLIAPSPRSWERVSAAVKTGAHPDVLLPLFCGYLGEAVGTDFHYTLKTWFEDAPSIPELMAMKLTDVKKRLPKKPTILYTIGYNLVLYCSSLEEYVKVMEIFGVIGSISNQELQFSLMELLLKKATQTAGLLRDLARHPSIAEHISKYKELMAG